MGKFHEVPGDCVKDEKWLAKMEFSQPGQVLSDITV